MNRLVWIQPGTSGEPAWTAGGSYFVVRLIRMLVEFWDRVDITEQENMIGRRRATGYPLSANRIHATPNFATDPSGAVIPLTSHIRLANPRTPQTADSRILRRGYNYELAGLGRNGNSETGLIFACYQQNIQDQFEANQVRLIDEPMTDYIQPYGGGYFIGLPGITDGSGYLGQPLFS